MKLTLHFPEIVLKVDYFITDMLIYTNTDYDQNELDVSRCSVLPW